jgi:hypothetical protein
MLGAMTGQVLPESYDPVYFSADSWTDRVSRWIVETRAQEFADGNEQAVRQAISGTDSGLVAVINIGTHAILRLLPDGRYLNLYERPEIGGRLQKPTETRERVDAAMDIRGPDVYFAALALGGCGIRFYGEYCLVLALDEIDPDPQLFDRDSYDILLPPFTDPELADPAVLVGILKGRWHADRYAMSLMKVLPELDHRRRLATTGTVSELLLKDQEYIEIHLHPARATGDEQPEYAARGGFGRPEVDEVRESPDDVAAATRLRERSDDGLLMTEVEYEWLLRREAVTRVLTAAGLPARVVTQHGRGYQWK